jgi:putative Mg2+ transporter-C (MgtC) family protein
MKAPELTALAFLSRLSVGAMLGAAIGFERQFRQRSAGLHTSSLVAIGAALFALLDTTIAAGDTTRIVAGVVTGVGFIAGGVILRTGMNVTGLNTAATIWATAAVGALAGFGLWPQAVSGAAAIILFNLLLEPLADAIDVRAAKRQRREMVYTLTMVCDADRQSNVATALIKAVSDSPLALQSLTRQNADGKHVELRAEIFSARPDDAAIERFSAAILAMAGVESTDWRSAGA